MTTQKGRDTPVLRDKIAIGMGDGAILWADRWTVSMDRLSGRKSKAPSPIPLLCLPDELSNRREFHPFAERLMAMAGAPQTLFMPDMRGRGASADKGIGATDTETDADDLVAFCDATGLHHADVIVSGRSIIPLLRALLRRPGLVRRAVFNDAAPEFDGVGIAREAAQRAPGVPKTMKDATDQLRDLRKGQFSAFTDQDWHWLAGVFWREREGTLVRAYEPNLQRLSNTVDYDITPPQMWGEFAMLASTPLLVVRGDNSELLTDEILERMRAVHTTMETKVARGQGHVPALHLNDLAESIHAFLTG